jgi:hypothetical protein
MTEPGRPLAKAKEKAKKEYPPEKFHSHYTSISFLFLVNNGGNNVN